MNEAIGFRDISERGEVPTFVVEIGPETDLILAFVNSAFEEATGLRKEGIVGKRLEDLPGLSSEDSGVLRTECQRCVQSGEAVRLVGPFREPGQEPAWPTDLTPLRDSTGRILRVVGTVVNDKRETTSIQDPTRPDRPFWKLVENLPDFIIRYDRELRRTYVNPAWGEATGLSAEEVLGVPLSEPLRASSPITETYVSAVQEVLETGTSQTIEFDWTNARGQMLFMQYELTPEHDSAGEISGVVAIGRNISERKRAEDALRESELRYREVFENISDCIFTLDVTPEGRFRFVEFNPAEERSVGYPSSEVSGKLVEEAIPAELAAQVTENYRRCLETGTLVSYEEELSLPVGRRFFNTVLIPIRNASGEVYRIVGLARDTTEQKLAEEALNRSQTQLEAAMDLANLVNWEFDVDSGLFTFNDRFYALYGTTAEAEGGYQMPAEVYAERFLHPDDRHLVAEEVVRAEQTSDPNYRPHVEHRIVRRDGEIRDIVVRYGITKDEQGRTVKTRGANQDITERKRAEEALAMAEEQLLQAQKMEAVGQLAGGIAHDFNNLLTVIGGSASLLLADMSPGDTRRKLAADIKETTDRAADLTRQILAFSRRQTLRPRVLSLNEVVKGLESLLSRTLREDVALTVSLAPDLASTQVDPVQLEQVLMNLAVNARDAMPDGGRLVIETANVTLDDEYARIHPWVEPGSYVMLSVSDTGCGMSAATMGRVFEPFFSTKPVGTGTGLGLSTVYGIVKQSGGSITTYSEPGRGSTFRIFLPVAGEAVGASTRPPAETTEVQGGSETIMVVEDEEAVRELIVHVLTRAGYRVLPGGCFRELMSLLEGEKTSPNLLVTDMVLPEGVDGQSVAERLRQRYPGLPVLFMSGYTQKTVAPGGSLGAKADFLEKPFELAVLLRRVRGLLDAKGTMG